ncbi:MAG: hypothetical protein VW524_04265 [Halieaceae bacterium]
MLMVTLSGCGIGSGGSDDPDSSSGSQNVVDEQQLAIELSGDTRYRADQRVSLAYVLSGDSVSGASVSYQGPVELIHDPIAQTLKADAVPPGVYTVTLTAKADKYIAEATLELFIDANFGGQYVSSDELKILTMGRGEISDATDSASTGDDSLAQQPQQRATIFWYVKADDSTAFIESLCTADITVDGDQAIGSGLCKQSVGGQKKVFTTLDVLVVYQDTGGVQLTYSFDGDGTSFDFSLNEIRDNYIATDLDLSGVYRSVLTEGLDYLLVSGLAGSGESMAAADDGSGIQRCSITGNLSRYDASFIAATEGDGSILKISDMVIDNCDLSSEAGYRIAVGEATGSNQSGLLSVLQSGISDSVTRFDIYAYRGADYTDPLSKLRYARVCFNGAPTSLAADYDVSEAMCESLSSGL